MLLVGAVKRALLVSKLFLRYLLVAFTWFVFVPYATKMLFAIYFRWSTGPPDKCAFPPFVCIADDSRAACCPSS